MTRASTVTIVLIGCSGHASAGSGGTVDAAGGTNGGGAGAGGARVAAGDASVGGVDALPSAGGSGGAQSTGGLASMGGRANTGGRTNTGGADAGAGAAGGMQSGGSDAGSGVDAAGTGVLGQPCPHADATACAGHAQKEVLRCFGGLWESAGSCSKPNEFCTTTLEGGAFEPYAICKLTPPECSGRGPGFLFCEATDVVARCGADLVSFAYDSTCSGTTPDCQQGACVGCATNATRCSGDAVETCQPSGAWGIPVACPTTAPFCSGGACISVPPSCSGLTANCGPAADEPCCTSTLVTGGTFYRSYDGVSNTDQSAPATVSNFRLDRFEVTVGRFRKFVDAWISGWRPEPGAGKHAHLNGGLGLAIPNGGNEPGWDYDWTTELPSSAMAWDGEFGRCYQAAWTPSVGPNENRPIDCIDWLRAYAFCIWDRGFLPSEAEWNYAASGGVEQRVYPWSAPPSSTLIDCSHANYHGASGGTDYCVSAALTNRVGSESPLGDGKYGQADLAGNAKEYALDDLQAYAAPCKDCVMIAPPMFTGFKVVRGGSFDSTLLSSYMLSSHRDSGDIGPGASKNQGARCARSP